jgi:hypothetical protein
MALVQVKELDCGCTSLEEHQKLENEESEVLRMAADYLSMRRAAP